MRLIEEHQRVLRQIVDQGRRRLSGQTACKVSAVVLNAFAEAHLMEHFQVKERSFADSLSFKQLAAFYEFCLLVSELIFDSFNSAKNIVSRRDVVRRRINGEAVYLLTCFTGQRIEEVHCFDFVIEKFDTQRHFRVFRRKHVDRIAADAELTARKFHVVALVLDAHQMRNQTALLDLVTDFQDQTHFGVGLGLTDTVNRGDRGHNNHIAAFQHAL